MGWRPDEVRACTMAEFAAAQEGWLAAQGVDLGPTREDVAEMEALMARYPSYRAA
jgi:predicted lipoprotein